jgi:hypothetical protein
MGPVVHDTAGEECPGILLCQHTLHLGVLADEVALETLVIKTS